jgi:serine phosphatase RsbU (regulator of sigma subunit)
LYRRTRGALRVAEILQRSLLPASIPTLEGWDLSAHYEPAAGGRVGGDWYDAFTLRDGRLIVLLGDVAGHGLTVAGTMAQLRNALRAQLFAGAGPAEALTQLNEFSVHMLPGAFATGIVARVDLASGEVEAASAGHLMPYLTNSSSTVAQAPIRLSLPIGVRNARCVSDTFTLEPNHGMVLFSDGLVERRGQFIDDGLHRLAGILGDAQATPAPSISTAMATGETDDDITIVALRRH